MNNDLISRAALLKDLELLAKFQPEGKQSTILGVCATIRATHAVDAEPVRHGRWIIVCDTDDGWWREWYAKCSKCGRTILLNEYICETQSPEKALTEYPYCHCGAKMDEEVTNG